MSKRVRAVIATAILIASALSATDVRAVGATIAGCPLFPDDNEWQRNITSDSVDPNSAAYVASISQTAANIHPDFGSNPNFGIPLTIVPPDQKPVKIKFTEFGDESDPGPYPIPRNAPIEGGGDRHTLVVQSETCKLFELYHAQRARRGKWKAGSGAVFDLRINDHHPAGFTSADAAGLPIAPGLARRDEVESGTVLHALRFTASRTQQGYVDPARHHASSDTNPALPPMGLRLRLKSTFDTSRFTGASRVILDALKTYGMILADNGSSGFISGARDSGWNDDDLNQLKTVPLSAFEAIKHGTIHR